VEERPLRVLVIISSKNAHWRKAWLASDFSGGFPGHQRQPSTELPTRPSTPDDC
jgi:hypothetical protein